MGFILTLITWILTPILEILNLFIVLWVKKKEHSFLKTINLFFKNGAIDRDRFGNHNYKTLLNTLLIKNTGYRFGNILETISSALGKNQRDNTLTWLGWGLVYLLWAIDYQNWKKGGHCIASINNNV